MAHDVLAMWNGQVMPLAEVTLPATDRAYMFGEGVYEVVRVYQGKPFCLSQHLERLRRNLASLQIDHSSVQSRLDQLLRESSVQNGYIYLQISTTADRRSHVMAKAGTNELIYVDKYPDDFLQREQQDGVSALTVPDQRWSRCDIKSTCLLANTMAKAAAKRAGAFEALFCSAEGDLREGGSTNLFCVRAGEILTPPLDGHILPGITRDVVLGLAAQLAIPCKEAPLPQADVPAWEEVFLTGTSSEVIPVIRVNDTAIGAGKRGPVTRQVQQAWRQHIMSTCSN